MIKILCPILRLCSFAPPYLIFPLANTRPCKLTLKRSPKFTISDLSKKIETKMRQRDPIYKLSEEIKYPQFELKEESYLDLKEVRILRDIEALAINGNYSQLLMFINAAMSELRNNIDAKSLIIRKSIEILDKAYTGSSNVRRYVASKICAELCTLYIKLFGEKEAVYRGIFLQKIRSKLNSCRPRYDMGDLPARECMDLIDEYKIILKNYPEFNHEYDLDIYTTVCKYIINHNNIIKLNRLIKGQYYKNCLYVIEEILSLAERDDLIYTTASKYRVVIRKLIGIPDQDPDDESYDAFQKSWSMQKHIRKPFELYDRDEIPG